MAQLWVACYFRFFRKIMKKEHDIYFRLRALPSALLSLIRNYQAISSATWLKSYSFTI